MRLWTFTKIVTPIALAFSAIIFPDSQKALIVSACVTSVFSILTLVGDASFENKIFSKISLLSNLQANHKTALVSHKSDPHIVATATIDITANPPLQIESHGICDVVDCGVGDFKILVDVPFGKNLIPRIESDIPFSPSVLVIPFKNVTCVEVKWHKTEPKIIYFSLASSANNENV